MLLLNVFESQYDDLIGELSGLGVWIETDIYRVRKLPWKGDSTFINFTPCSSEGCTKLTSPID